MSAERRYLNMRCLAQTAELRHARFEGAEHVVVPVVAMVGDSVVHPVNAETPELVPAVVLAEAPRGWNGRPVLPNHPDGGRASANDPRTLEQMRIGTLFDTRFEDGRLKTEAWVDVARAESLGGDAADVVRRLRDGETVEVSVGAWVTGSRRTGTRDGRRFEFVWTNVIPDHLAVLPAGAEGACSVDMGCGAPRAAQGFEIQTLIFPKDKWDSAADARAWARDHDFSAGSVDETSTSFRLRQRDPDDFTRLRTICISPGRDTAPEDCRVQAVGGPVRPEARSQRGEEDPMAREAQLRAAIRETARRPTFSGTESTEWTAPTLATFISAFNLGDVSSVGDLSAAQKRRVAATSLLGDPAADVFAELVFFPVVNPRTGSLNERALRAVIGGRGSQANIPAAARESAQLMARRLLNSEFDADLEVSMKKPNILQKLLALVTEIAEESDDDLELTTGAVKTCGCEGECECDLDADVRAARQKTRDDGEGHTAHADDPPDEAEKGARAMSTAVKTLVGRLITSDRTPFTGDDEELLLAMTEDKLVAMEEKFNEEPYIEPEPEPEPKTTEEWLDSAPGEVRSMVKRYQSEEAERRTLLVNSLARAQSSYTKEQLEKKSTEDLQSLCAVLKINAPKRDYSGRGLAAQLDAGDDVVPAPPDMGRYVRAKRAGKSREDAMREARSN